MNSTNKQISLPKLVVRNLRLGTYIYLLVMQHPQMCILNVAANAALLVFPLTFRIVDQSALARISDGYSSYNIEPSNLGIVVCSGVILTHLHLTYDLILKPTDTRLEISTTGPCWEGKTPSSGSFGYPKYVPRDL